MNGLEGVRDRYDVVVVGARAAGAATAMLLARCGVRVLAVDRGGYGTDTLSTHALMRAGVLQLARWGLLERIEAEGTPRVQRTVFHYEDEVLDILIKPRHGVPALFAPRRTVLDRILVDAAWHYCRPPVVKHRVDHSLKGQPAARVEVARRAQARLHKKYIRLVGRGKSRQTAVVALARELCGFVWSLAVA